jgi:SNF2 family DNA or RNA helicase
LTCRDIPPLWGVQERAVEFAMSRPATMLNMDMGTGKTRVSLEILRRSEAKLSLVIAPKSVVPVWPGEIAKFLPDLGIRCEALDRDPIRKRAERIRGIREGQGKQEGPIVVIINYDVIWRPVILHELKAINWDLVILDESHRAKSAGSKTSKACYDIGKKARKRLCLSGTPMSNSPLDIFGQYKFLDDRIFGRYWGRFTDEFAIKGGPERQWIVGVKNQEELSRRFHSIAFTCTKEDIRREINLVDPPEETTRWGYLSPPARKIYNELERDFVVDLKGRLVSPQNVLVRLLRFQQITSGFVETTDEMGRDPQINRFDNYKIKLLRELLEDLPGQVPVVVFYRFRMDLEEIRSGVEGREVYEISGDRNELEEWKQDNSGVLAVQYSAGAEGISLVHSSYLVFYSGTYSLAEYNQAVARVYRPGQMNPVTVINLVMRDTIDEAILEAIRSKENLVDRVISLGRIM